MIMEYTTFNKLSIENNGFENNIDDAIDYIKNPKSFRNFDEGLKEIIIKKDYPVDVNNDYETADFLISKLHSIGSDIEASTVNSWFITKLKKENKPRPKIEAGSRKRIYEICFALCLNIFETEWFFKHVYYDRPFNYHTIDEAVFYYAFIHELSYKHALEIINEINDTPAKNEIVEHSIPNYTIFVRQKISEISSVEELKEFLIENKQNFNSWNKSALSSLNTIISELIGSEACKKDIDSLKRTLTRKVDNHVLNYSVNESDFSHCGLLIREIIFDSKIQNMESQAEYILGAINNKNIRKNTFILERLLLTSSGLKKNNEIPYVVRNNFPSKKIMSDVLSEEKISVSKSYDSIRKVLILLDFYRFWISVKLDNLNLQYSRKELAENYQEETDDCLFRCGYNELYHGNPYDWIFLCAAQNEDPIEYFRSCVNELLPD